MKNRNSTALALGLLGLAMSASQARAQSTYVPYAFTNFAGMPGGPGTNDGTGSAARFNYPTGVALDIAGNVYVADTGSSTIREITPAGVVTTLAGRAGQYGTNDGIGGAARFYGPGGVALDNAGNLYVADSGNSTIRKITAAGEVTTLAGSAGQYGTNDGIGSAARFNGPRGVAVDGAGNVYVADTYNETIRKITSDLVVTTLAGSAGQQGSTDGTGSAARFFEPTSVALDSAGTVYVADQTGQTIRKVTPTGEVTTLAGAPTQGTADGTGSTARFTNPAGVAADTEGNVYVADSSNDTVRKITPAGQVTTLAGIGGVQGSADGTGTDARFYAPNGVAVDSAGNVYVADTSNDTIRKITPTGEVLTLAGSAEYGSADGSGSAAQFNEPVSVAVDSAGNVYVADRSNETIRKITPNAVVTTLAGSAGQIGTNDGIGRAARFFYPTGVAVDSAGNVYVAEPFAETIRKITPAGAVTTLAGSAGQYGTNDGIGSAARFRQPTHLAVDSTANVYVADSKNCTIRRITPGGVVTTLAGSAGRYGSADGMGSAARFNVPEGVAVDSAGNVYVADYFNDTIRKITATGAVTTLAGSVGLQGRADGAGSVARFRQPADVAVDSAGNVYVADAGNNRITIGTPLLQFDTSAGSLMVSNGLFQMLLIGRSGSSVVVEASTTLQTWTPVQTNALLRGGLDVAVSVGTNQNQFFRARLAP